MNYEEKYWELREAVDKAFDKYFFTHSPWDFAEYEQAKEEFQGYCVDVLTQLMEENSDVLKRLKKI